MHHVEDLPQSIGWQVGTGIRVVQVTVRNIEATRYMTLAPEHMFVGAVVHIGRKCIEQTHAGFADCARYLVPSNEKFWAQLRSNTNGPFD